MRTLPLLPILLLAAAGCLQDPPGRCEAHTDCAPGNECANGVCVKLVTDGLVGSRCVRESDCALWADCTAAEVCALTPGMCADGADCSYWQACNGSHACVTAPGFCAAEADCELWQDCGADHLCALTPGMCGTTTDCSPWQVCGATSFCELAPNGCEDSTGCASWQTCESYRCATAPGFCAVGADCPSWMECGADHLCAVPAGSPWAHTIVIDGTNDFTDYERIATSTAGYTGWVSWDADALFVGLDGPAVGSGDLWTWVLLYLGASGPTTTTGMTYNTQAPTLPFGATHHVRLKVDQSFFDVKAWDGSLWAGYPAANVTFSLQGTYVEFRIPRASLGDPAAVSIVAAMIREQATEWTFAGLPADAFVDGLDPDYARYLRFDLGAGAAPATYLSLP